MRWNDYEMAINTVPRRCACKRWIYEFWWWFQKQKRANEPVNETKQREKKKMNSTNWEHTREKKITFYWITLWLSRSFSLIKHESVFARALKYDFVFIRMRSRSGRYRRLHASISLEFVSHRLLFGATKSTTTTCAAMHCNMTCHSVFGEHAHVFAIWFVCSII